jgi:hypothetical protein
MRNGTFHALLGWGLLLAGEDALAQTANATPPPLADAPARAWSFSAAAYTYLLPDETDYVQPAFTADRDKLHFEARYNYEGRNTASAWIGYNLSFGETVTFDLTPMIGAVFGDTNGIAPGYRLSLAWRKLELVSESEYVFDSGGSEDSFFYTWSELAWAPSDWFRLGMVVQRTRAYETELDIQRGFLLGVSWKKASFTTYVFNPDTDRTTVVLGVVLDF